jgi:hypothetical protein
MNKVNYLEFLKKMLQDYYDFAKTGQYQWHFSSGFCVYIHRFNGDMHLIFELKKDRLFTTRNMYWYPPFKETNCMLKSILPRIAHLERTIARLEKEISTQQL